MHAIRLCYFVAIPREIATADGPLLIASVPEYVHPVTLLCFPAARIRNIYVLGRV
jgi:hypothetical protein